MIFWNASPDYYYNSAKVESLQEYEIPNYGLLLDIEQKIFGNKYETLISYEIEEMFRLEEYGNIPIELTKAVEGTIKYQDILWPNNNPFQDGVLAICQNCNSIDEVYELEKKGADFTKKILNGYSTPIEVAVNYGQTEVIKYFAEKDFNFNKKFNGNPLLFNAISNKHYDTIQLLIENDADVNKKGTYGRTVMHQIASIEEFDNSLEKIASFLISKGAKHNIGDVDKKKPLDLAKMWNNEKFIQFLKNQE